MISEAPEAGFLRRIESHCLTLCLANWQDPDGPMRLNRGLPGTNLRKAAFFQNTRRFLVALQEQGGTEATATGNLNRVFVRHMFECMTLPPLIRETMIRINKVFNENDLWDLHRVRVVSELAGLVRRRSRHFKLTKKGTALLADDRAGELYYTLFVAYFREFDLHYDFNFRDVPGIQKTMAVILWRIDDALTEWLPVEGLAPRILLPKVLDQIRNAMVSEHDREEWILSGYVLEPLYRFGLIEKRVESDWPRIDEKDAVRITPLWKKFISFRPFGW